MIIYASTQDPTYNDFNNFLLNYGVFIAIGVAALIATIVVVLLVLQKRVKKPVEVKKSYSHSEIYDALGGKENILTHSKVGSRISLTLKDYDVVNEAKLNALGVNSIIKMSNKIILVIKDDSDSLYKMFD